MKAMYLLVTAFLTISSVPAIADSAAWLGTFAHVPTAYDLTPPVTVTGRDGNPRTLAPNYAPAPAYRANVTVREVVRLSAAASSIRVRLSNEFSGKPLPIGAVHVAL